MDRLRESKLSRITKSLRLPTREVNDTSSIQLIDGNGKFNVNGLNNFSKMVNLSSCGLSYAVVSIIGPQSSGKSTLVNHLFGTTFKQMDAARGRSQTTKGIWLSKAADIKPCTLVIDVEGSDGMERGEDGVLFEKQSALFALAVSDVVLVNMWCIEVGRESGGGRPLLKIVFEKIMCLISPRKLKLVFVLRDETETPLDALEKTLMTSVREIYASVPKPKAYESAPLDRFFNVQVITLASYQYDPEGFKEQVGIMNESFIDSTAPTGYIGVQEDKVPSSEVPSSFPEIWKTIKEDKDLDLPAHKVMVATVRCDEIIKESLSKLNANQDWLRLEKSLKSGTALESGKAINSIINTILTEFDAKVVYFDEAIRSLKRQHLLEKIRQIIGAAGFKMLDHLSNKAIQAYKEKFDKIDRISDQAIQDCTAYSLSIFEKGAEEMENEFMSWQTSKYIETARERIVFYTQFCQLKADKAQADADREKALTELASLRTAAAKAESDAKIAIAKAAATAAAAAKEAAKSEAAAEAQKAAAEKAAAEARAEAQKAAAEKAAAEARAEAATRAIAAGMEAAKRAEAAAKEKKNSLTGWLKNMATKGLIGFLEILGINWRME